MINSTKVLEKELGLASNKKELSSSQNISHNLWCSENVVQEVSSVYEVKNTDISPLEFLDEIFSVISEGDLLSLRRAMSLPSQYEFVLPIRSD